MERRSRTSAVFHRSNRTFVSPATRIAVLAPLQSWTLLVLLNRHPVGFFNAATISGFGARSRRCRLQLAYHRAKRGPGVWGQRPQISQRDSRNCYTWTILARTEVAARLAGSWCCCRTHLQLPREERLANMKRPLQEIGLPGTHDAVPMLETTPLSPPSLPMRGSWTETPSMARA